MAYQEGVRAGTAPRRTLYVQLAEELASAIREGVWATGERLPSVRGLCSERGLSAATVMRAHELLEAWGYVESVPRSGHFVSSYWRDQPGRKDRAPAPGARRRFDVEEIAFQLLDSVRDRSVVPFGSAFPSPELFPLAQLGRALAASARCTQPWRSVQELVSGSPELRQRIAQRYLQRGARVSPQDIVITSGALEALNLCVQAITRPGDTIVIQAPTFYGCLYAVRAHGLRILEVPANAPEGVDLTALAEALAGNTVRACWLMTTFHNPLGVRMSAGAKRELVRLLEKHDVPLIEDNVYAELYFGSAAPRMSKAFDRRDLVLDCGTFSKCLAPGYRVGWVAAGRYAEAVRRCKLMSSLETNIAAQDAIAAFLRTGAFERHLRRLRRTLARQQAAALDALHRHLPSAARIITPDGGYFLWIELPDSIDAVELHRRALADGISIAPGPIFSATRGFRHCLRLNYGHPWTAASDRAVARLAELMRTPARSAAA
jgi:DNA-binding transcriptional MocR family regulator